jgi:hypothetical protein
MGKDNKHDKEKDYNYALMGLVLLVAIIGLMMALWSPITPAVSIVSTEPFNQAGYAALGRCTDYDSGKDYFKASYVMDKEGPHVDECLASGLLRENYCLIKGSSSTWKYIDFNCPLGCYAGACKTCGDGVINSAKEECDAAALGGASCLTKGFSGGVLKCYAPGTANECKYDTSGCVKAQCNDTDGGLDYYTKGSAISPSGAIYYDGCEGNNGLVEAYCLDNEATTTEFTCPYGCDDGACAVACVDSDGGKITEIAGTASGEYGRATDTCASSNSVKEYYCQDSIAVRQKFLLGNSEFTYMIYRPTDYTVTLQDSTGINQVMDVNAPEGWFTLVVGGREYQLRVGNVLQSDSPIYPLANIIIAETITCASGACSNGACLAAQCTDGSSKVCTTSGGYPGTQICTSGVWGICNPITVTETITCAFMGAMNITHYCYALSPYNANCTGISSCQTRVSGDYGSNVYWSSNCLGNPRTTLDGVNEVAYFNCTTG